MAKDVIRADRRRFWIVHDLLSSITWFNLVGITLRVPLLCAREATSNACVDTFRTPRYSASGNQAECRSSCHLNTGTCLIHVSEFQGSSRPTIEQFDTAWNNCCGDAFIDLIQSLQS